MKQGKQVSITQADAGAKEARVSSNLKKKEKK